MTNDAVLLVYPHIAHYRRDVLLALAGAEGLDLTIAADTTSLEPGIATVPFDEFPSTCRLVNRQWKRAVWQKGSLGLALRGKYDVYIFVGSAAYLSTWIAASVCRARGKRVLFWTIGWHRPEAGLKRLVRLTFYRLAHELLLYGRWGAEFGEAAGYPMARMRIVGNSVAKPTSAAATESLDLSALEGAELVVGAVIRLTDVKALDLLIAAAREVRSNGVDCRVILAGDGAEREALRQQADGLGVPLVMPGAVYSAPALRAIYDVLDVTVVPGAVGLTAVQSMHHGVPVITHDDKARQMPEAEAVRHMKTGLTFDAGDPSTLSAALMGFHALGSQDRQSMARECRAEAHTWSPEVTASKIVAAVRSA